MLNWRELIVSDNEGKTGDTLGFFVDNAPANLDNAVIENGRIVEWTGFFLSAPDETPDWDTPKVDVDWSGFEDTLNSVRGRA
jgi:hypothetical protein